MRRLLTIPWPRSTITLCKVQVGYRMVKFVSDGATNALQTRVWDGEIHSSAEIHYKSPNHVEQFRKSILRDFVNFHNNFLRNEFVSSFANIFFSCASVDSTHIRKERKRAQFLQKPINNWKLIQIALGTSFSSLSFSWCPITNFQIAHINSIMIRLYGLQFEREMYPYLFSLSYVTLDLHQPSKRRRENNYRTLQLWEETRNPYRN